MTNFYLTFGVGYRRDPHPHWPEVDPGGYVLIQARDEAAARQIARSFFGLHWAFMYPEDYFEPEYCPLGELLALTETSVLVKHVTKHRPPNYYGPFAEAVDATHWAQDRNREGVIGSWFVILPGENDPVMFHSPTPEHFIKTRNQS